ncbi:class I SAM-dependent methyltransferase [Dactylosporangium cerinum]|uniref:Class I SAM-dependent methyltransferase n=1 Tax=Dactylosporangium cerinum TaxID=1434730 RepID=A0ABV9WIT5_9ACTN
MLEYRTLDPLRVRIETHLRHSERDDDVDAAVLTAVGHTAADAVLDVGCGTGAFLRRLATPGANLGAPPGATAKATGVDTSPAAVAALDGTPGVEVRLGDAAALPWPDGTFDVVTARHMLYHVGEPVEAIREARRVLRPGGRFAAVVNIRDAYPAIHGLIRDAVAAHGFDPGVYTVAVHGDNLPGLVAAVFGETRVERHDNALVFHEPAPLVAYAVSMLTGFGVRDDDPARPAVVAWIAAEAARWFDDGGTVRDPKGYVIVTGW